MYLGEADQRQLGIGTMDYFDTNLIAQSSNHKCQYMCRRNPRHKNGVLIVNMCMDRQL
jgi:hypothetical protein